VLDKAANDTAAAFMHAARSARSVKDPDVAEKLLPRDHPIGTKRLCVDTNYYETYNRPNVTLVDLQRDADRARSRATGVKHAPAEELEVDVIVFATGFDAMTGALLDDRHSRAGTARTLADAWAAGPRTYLGLHGRRASRTCSWSPARAARRCCRT
jgi:cyclohexanone monooxygenase